jgi:hypothetical protein
MSYLPLSFLFKEGAAVLPSKEDRDIPLEICRADLASYNPRELLLSPHVFDDRDWTYIGTKSSSMFQTD